MIKVVEKEIIDNEYGEVVIKLKDILDKKNISRSKLSRITNIKYDIITKYYYNTCNNINKKTLAKLCYALDCRASNIIEYVYTNSD